MTHSDIEAFLLIVKTGSLSATAQKLFVSQPALSRRLKNLETKLGVRLFERGRGEHAVILTPAGKAFLSIAEKWNDLIQETSNLALIEHALPTFTIDAVGTVAKYVLSPVFHQFALQHQDVHLNITRHHSKECYEVIASGTAALGFVTEDQYYQNVETVPAFREPMVLLARNDSLFHQDIHPSTLDVSHEILIPWNSEFTQWHSYWFSSFMRPLIKVWDISLAEPFLTDRSNWIIAPQSIAANFCRQKPNYAYYRLSAPPAHRIVYYLVKSGPPNPYTAAFLDLTHQHLCSIDGIESLLFQASST